MNNFQEDDPLWNELSHQQHREIAQHRARIASEGSLSLSNARRLYNRSRNEIERVGAVFYDAIAGAYETATERSRERIRYHEAPTRDQATGYLDEFGIPQEGDMTNENHYTEFGEAEQVRHANDFVLLDQFRLKRNEWGAVANLDVFFTNIYLYYYHRGLVPLLCKGIVELITLFFTLFLSVFLFAYVDWHALSLCHDEDSCKDYLSDYIHHRPLATFSLWSSLVILYCLLFLLYGVFAVASFVNTIQAALQSKYIFEEKLGITARRLQGGAIDWDRDVVGKLIQLQQSGEYRIAIHGQEFDALTIANRILRKENFMVALMNRGVLDFTVPFTSTQFYSDSLEWSIYFCVLNFMFNHRYQLRPAFYLDHASLKRRFIICGIAHAIFMPFLIFFLTLHFGLKNVYDWKNSKQYLGPRDWSAVAKWSFREFNELQHHFEKRMAPSYAAANGYIKLFGANEVIAAAGRILVFIGGSLGAVLIVFAAINDAVLLHVKIADWNLLWYAGMFGIVYSVGKAMIPPPEAQVKNARNIFAEIDTALSNVATHTHFYPDHWRGRGWKSETYKSFSSMYKFKAQIFAVELASLVAAPYILCVSLVKCAGPICEYVLSIRSEMAGAGDVCGYATFDFDAFGDEGWEGKTMGGPAHIGAATLNESIMRFGSVEEATRRHPKPKCRHGKMEKSFFTFKVNHPSWKCGESGQKLVDEIEDYKKQEQQSVTREQQVYIDAAARQLETFARIQGRNEGSAPLRMKESYINSPPETHADAAAGSANFASTLGLDRRLGPVPEGESSGNLHVSGISDDVPPFASNVTSTISPTSFGQSTRVPSNPSVHSDMIHSSLPASLGLSSDLRRILNLSTLDPHGSFLVDQDGSDEGDHLAERQYLWLERYHSHLASQRARDSGISDIRESHENVDEANPDSMV